MMVRLVARGLLVSAALLHAGVTPVPLACRITPQVIKVDAFYDGATVRIEGAVDAGSKVLVTVAGPQAEERFNLKGRFGPIWLNAGKVRISGVPSLFLRFSSEPLETLLEPGTIRERAFDEASLTARMRLEPRGIRGDARTRADYLALRETDGTYAFHSPGIAMNATEGNMAGFALAFQWPKKAPPAAYEVRVYEIRQRSIVREICLPLEVVRAGFPAWLAETAYRQPSLYGVVAVCAGMLAGFGIDMLTTLLFGKKRKFAH